MLNHLFEATPIQKENLKNDPKIFEIIHEAKIDRNKTNVKFDDISYLFIVD